MASRVCSAKTMERFIDPVIADLQAEYAEELQSGRVWKIRWTLAVGYAAFAKVFLLCGMYGAAHAWRDWSHDDHRGLVRVARWSSSASLLITLLLLLPELPRTRGMIDNFDPHAGLPLLMAYLVPMTLPLSLPIGLAIGAAFTAQGRVVSRRLVVVIMLVALAVSATSFVTLAWVIPATNQSYREAVMGRSLVKGDRELTLSELRPLAATDSHRTRGLVFEFHKRLGIAGAPITFAALALVVTVRRRARRVASGAAICVAVFGFYATLWLGNGFSKDGTLSPPLAAWMPQMLLLLTTILVALPANLTRTRA
jgi:hypothetical protein